MTEEFELITDKQGVRDFRAMRNEFAERQLGDGVPRPTAPGGSRIVQVRTAIAANDFDQHAADQVRLVAGTWETVGTVQIRNISGLAIPAASRLIAAPVSNLGLCIEALSASAPSVIPAYETENTCCGTHLSEGVWDVGSGSFGPDLYRFIAPYIDCCGACDGVSAYDWGGELVTLQGPDYESDSVACGDSGTQWWAYDPATGVLSLMGQETGQSAVALATWTADTAPPVHLAPIRLTMTTSTAGCRYCLSTICLKPVNYSEVVASCWGCTGEEIPVAYRATWSDTVDDTTSSQTVIDSRPYSTDQTIERELVERWPDLSGISELVLRMDELTDPESPSCTWFYYHITETTYSWDGTTATLTDVSRSEWTYLAPRPDPEDWSGFEVIRNGSGYPIKQRWGWVATLTANPGGVPTVVVESAREGYVINRRKNNLGEVVETRFYPHPNGTETVWESDPSAVETPGSSMVSSKPRWTNDSAVCADRYDCDLTADNSIPEGHTNAAGTVNVEAPGEDAETTPRWCSTEPGLGEEEV